jgi:hypothetical protein
MELETDVDMSELANLPPVSISFEVTLPDEEEVVTLLQVPVNIVYRKIN